MKMCVIAACFGIVLLVGSSHGSGDSECPRDPEEIIEDTSPKGYSEEQAKCQKHVFVQKVYRRCEPRFCCSVDCGCDDEIHEQRTSCAVEDNAVELECFVEHKDEVFANVYSCCSGYEQDENGICVKIIDCAVNGGGCGEHTICENGKCLCKSGFEKQNRTTCSNIDECAIDSDGCSHHCVDEVGTYRCSCDPGYTLFSDGHTCKDIDECDTNTDGCEHGCINDIGTYRCTCNSGYTLTSGGKNCQPLDLHVPQSLAASSSGTAVITIIYIAIPVAVLVLIILLIVALIAMRNYKRKHKRAQQQQTAMAMTNNQMIVGATPIQLSAIEWQLQQQQLMQQPMGIHPLAFGGQQHPPRAENIYANSQLKNGPPDPNGAVGVNNQAFEDDGGYETVKVAPSDEFDYESNKLNEFKENLNESSYATHIDKPTEKSVYLNCDNLK